MKRHARTPLLPHHALHGALVVLSLLATLVVPNAAAIPTATAAEPAASAAASAASWAADPEAARAAALLASIHQAHWVQEGQGPRAVYIFFDPNCPYSHKLYLATRVFVGKNGLALRWIPVGELEASSPGKAAAILAATDPLLAFQHNENDWNFGDSPAGGIRPLEHPPAKVLDELHANAQLMQRARLHTFPVMLYRTRKGHAQLIVGLLPDKEIGSVLRLAQ